MTQTTDPYDELAALFMTGGSAAAAESASPAAARTKAALELLVMGNLPVRAGLWLTPYADAVARDTGPVALVRLDGDDPMLQVLRDEGAEDAPSVGACRNLREAVLLLGPSIRSWLVRPSAQHDDAEALVAAGADRITLMTGADEAAVIRAYELVKSYAGAAEAAGAGPEIALAFIGVEEGAARELASRIDETAAAQLGATVALARCLPRIDAGVHSSYLRSFPGHARPALRDVMGWIEEARGRGVEARPAPLVEVERAPQEPGAQHGLDAPDSPGARDTRDARPSADTAWALEPRRQAPPDPPKHDPDPPRTLAPPSTIHPPSSAMRPPSMPPSMPPSEPTSAPPRVSPGPATAPPAETTSTPADHRGPADRAESAVHADRADHDVPTDHAGPPSALDAHELVERALGPGVVPRRRMQVSAAAAAGLEPKAPEAVVEPEEHGRPVPLAQYAGGLRVLRPRCPDHEHVELAVDDRGGLHVLGREATIREMRVVERWAVKHRELLTMACPEHALAPSGAVACHIFTDDPVRVADLHDSGLHLHVLAPVDVGGARGWYAARLNRP